MEFTVRTLQQKIKGKWVIISSTKDPDIIKKNLCEELTCKYLFRRREIKKIQYTGIGIAVTYKHNIKAIYSR